MIHKTIVNSKLMPSRLALARKNRQKMTLAEKTLWDSLRRNRLNGTHFRRQQPIGEYIVDFYCHKHGLIIEVDGDVHETQKEYDADREKNLISDGYRILRFNNDMIMNHLNEVLKRVQEIILF